MTWLGKILAIVVMLLSLAWMWLTATDYTTRVNWKAQRDAYKKAFEEAVAARSSEHNRHQAEMESLYKTVDSVQKELIARRAELDTSLKANKDNKAELDRLTTAVATADIQVQKIQTSYNAAIKELDIVRDRNNKLEADRVELTITREQARRDELAARNEANLQRQIATDRARENDDLRAENAQLRATGGGDAYRLEGGGQHLGTIVVTYVYAKRAVARFKPASGLAIARLRADQLPKVGDVVAPLGARGAASLK